MIPLAVPVLAPLLTIRSFHAIVAIIALSLLLETESVISGLRAQF